MLRLGYKHKRLYITFGPLSVILLWLYGMKIIKLGSETWNNLNYKTK